MFGFYTKCNTGLKWVNTRKISVDKNLLRDKIKIITLNMFKVNPLSTNPAKWSITLKQFGANFPTNCFSVFDHFEGLALKGLTTKTKDHN